MSIFSQGTAGTSNPPSNFGPYVKAKGLPVGVTGTTGGGVNVTCGGGVVSQPATRAAAAILLEAKKYRRVILASDMEYLFEFTNLIT